MHIRLPIQACVFGAAESAPVVAILVGFSLLINNWASGMSPSLIGARNPAWKQERLKLFGQHHFLGKKLQCLMHACMF